MDEDHITSGTDPEYEVVIHPGSVSECTLEVNGQTRQLYKQQGVHKLKNGKHPTKHKIRLKAKGQNGRDLTIDVTDPRHSVAKITIELYGEDHDPMTGEQDEPEATFTVMNLPTTCPPDCQDS